MTVLDPGECMRLLSSARMGRVGFCTPSGPQILPVNHAVLEGSIVFRTDLYGAVAAGTSDGTVAFEADEIDDRMRSGWSVLVVGRPQHVKDPVELAEVFERLDEPWAPGPRPVVVRISPAQVSGRRFGRT
jgi:uncharacterized protein